MPLFEGIISFAMLVLILLSLWLFLNTWRD